MCKVMYGLLRNAEKGRKKGFSSRLSLFSSSALLPFWEIVQVRSIEASKEGARQSKTHRGAYGGKEPTVVPSGEKLFTAAGRPALPRDLHYS